MQIKVAFCPMKYYTLKSYDFQNEVKNVTEDLQNFYLYLNVITVKL